MEKLLITFGCSWMFGVGVGYTDGMTIEEFNDIAWDNEICDKLSFRGLLSNKLNFKNINFATGGSSNQKQFRLAKEFFFSTKFRQLRNEYDDIIVLWGITSTARNELFNAIKKEYKNFSYTIKPADSTDRSSKSHYDLIKGTSWPSYEEYRDKSYKNIDHKILSEINEQMNDDRVKNLDFDWPLSRDFAIYSYDLDSSIRDLINEIHMFNFLFKNLNIKNLWIDTFNHHNYQSILLSMEMNPNLDNFLFYNLKSRDLLSLILKSKSEFVNDIRYHFSSWAADNKKVVQGKNKKLLNPYSYHPTKLGHQEIFLILEPEIQKIIKE